MELNLSTTYHCWTNEQTERVNGVLEDIFEACIIDFRGAWEDHLSLVDFAYNNIY